MTGHHGSIGLNSSLSSDSVFRMIEYQTGGTGARLRLFEILAAQGVSASEADDLVAALEAGAVAAAWDELVELPHQVSGAQSKTFAAGWSTCVDTVANALEGLADRFWTRRSGRAVEAARLNAHIRNMQPGEKTWGA
ncbi:hypothetical protein [Streptomyces sp. NPDC002602]|uniref:hypothetical protein n=1 Tax=Streptomyces sp. NPDC002602 TaxID=3364654 RepID=UPI00367B0D9B